MKISRKYPAFLLVTTVTTSAGIFAGLLGMMRSTMENEITARGESTAEFLAQASGPLLLEKNYRMLEYNLAALAADVFIHNALVADHEGKVIASLDSSQVDKPVPDHLRHPPGYWIDTQRNAYHFSAPIRYAEVDLGTLILSLSRQPLQAALSRVTAWALGIVAAIASLIVLLALLLIRRELRPLRVMGEALETIAKGDFSQRVPVERDDEIGDLGNALNNMVRRSELFFHYVDKLVIDRLIADESLARPGGRESNLAVLFGDMRGYTSMSNRRSADEVVRIVNTYFHLYIEVIAHFGGIVDKTMGDAIMAVFEGRPDEAGSKHREQGALALAHMKVASRVLNALLLARPEVAARCGLEPREWGFAMATGPAIVGNIGSRRHMDYTVCGRVVNLAARLEGLTKHGEVIVDNFTRMDAGHLIELEALPPVQPKGFAPEERVIPHRLTSLSLPAARRMRGLMKRLFNYSFVQDALTPRDMPEHERHNWCSTHHRHLERIIEETPVPYFFTRADTDTVRVIDSPSGPLPAPPVI